MRSLSTERGQHPINLRLGVNAKDPARRMPARVWIEATNIKTTVWESLNRDKRLPPGAELANRWPVDAQSRGYGDGYAKQMASEFPETVRTRGGGWKTVFSQKYGDAGRNEAWDCRIYTYAALMVELWPHSMEDGLVLLAQAQGKKAGRDGGNVVPFPGNDGQGR